MKHRLSLRLAILLLAAAPLAGCGKASSPPGTITLYSGQHEQTTAKLVAAFERESGIKVAVRSSDEATLGNQIAAEGSSSPADVFYAENTPVLEELAGRGLLAHLDPSTLAAIPSRYDSGRGDWVGVSARQSVLVYDSSGLKSSEVPGELLALAQPRWRGKVGFAPSETDFQPLVSAVIKLDGAPAAERWLKGLAANSRTYPDNETVVAQVNNGESELGPINSYYWFRLRDELGAGATHSAVHYFKPGDPGDLLDVSGAAVLRSSAHPSDAQKLVAFLVSEQAQRLLAHSESFEYPLRPGVSAASALPPLSTLHPLVLTPAQLGTGSEALALEQKLGLL